MSPIGIYKEITKTEKGWEVLLRVNNKFERFEGATLGELVVACFSKECEYLYDEVTNSYNKYRKTCKNVYNIYT